MYHDVVDLGSFYASRLGQVARRMVSRRIRQIWPDVHGLRMLALGYGTPYLRPFRSEAERVLAIMPAAQGVSRWPRDGANLVALADESELPLPDNSIDRILVMHGIEFSEALRPMLRELWRIMADGGRILVVVPNRRGIWARLERTPFGHGHPYSPPQLSHLLRESMFQPLRATTALYMPPGRSRMILGSATAWERVGESWGLPFAGVVMIEAGKQVYVTGAREPRRRRRRLYLPVPCPPQPVTGRSERTDRARSSQGDST
ncbi:MAG: methyltransferase type 11 [Rhodospirillaceae bacterium]|nr:methyltransferase type 11 [Rhodospirillaceae bacterium]